MTTINITPELKITMLKLLVGGRDLKFTATATHTPRDTVLAIVSAHGYPDTDRMAWAVDVLSKAGNRIPERAASGPHRGQLLDGPTPSNAPSPAQLPSALSRAVVPQPAPRPVYTSTGEILHRAGESAYARTRALAAKISALLVDLTDRLTDEQDAHEAEVKAGRERAAVAARIAALEAEIAKLKGRPAKKVAAAPKASGNVTRGEFSCSATDCDRTFNTSHGLNVHQGRSHQSSTTTKEAS